MAIAPFLAMTAAELHSLSALSFPIAWMACHFSPYGTALSNLPKDLPPGSVLILDDITPPRGHDPVQIAEQLKACVEEFQCSAVLLDFQRTGCEETRSIARHLSAVLPCPTVVSEGYAGELACPVFLSPVPPSSQPELYFSPWKGREVWLELGLSGELLTLTERGCSAAAFPCPDPEAKGFSDQELCCHYTTDVSETAVHFTLWRNREDTVRLLAEAEKLGIVGAVGLYQEFASQGLQEVLFQKPTYAKTALDQLQSGHEQYSRGTY